MPNLLLDPTQRSAMMARIRSKNTKPEMIAFAELKARKISFRKHYERAAGRPDIARPRKKLAVFIDGDFWHGRELDRLILKHGENSAWVIKLRRNIARDVEQTAALESAGWLVLRIWESDLTRIRSRGDTMDLITAFLLSRDEVTT
jgi:DNA mismatch endonuclease (patch repair protein)